MNDISVPIWQMVLLFTAPAVIGCALVMFWQYINEKLTDLNAEADAELERRIDCTNTTF